MNIKPTFSVLIPIYNVEKFLSSCINSILNQTFKDWELILIDDGSADNSGKIADNFAKQYPDKIHVYHRSNCGPMASRRYAITKARGQYYIFMDSDDRLANNNALKILYDKFTQYDCDCIIYGIERIEANKSCPFGKIEKEELLTDKRSIYYKVFLNDRFNLITRKAVKAQVVGVWDFKPFEHIFYEEDLLQTLEVLYNSKKVLFLPDCLYSYYVNADSITNKVIIKPFWDPFEVRAQVLKFLKKEKVFTKQDMQEYHRYCISLFEYHLRQICLHPINNKEKIALFKSLKRKAYFLDFLHSPKYKPPFSRFYTPFCLSWYGFLIKEVKFWNFLSILKHKFYDKK